MLNIHIPLKNGFAARRKRERRGSVYRIERYEGFTLIEMMFLVLVLSFVVIQIAQVQRTRTQEQTVEHAASDMLNWEEAIVYYYTQYSIWPQSLTDITSASSPTMPTTALCSPFALSTGSDANCKSSIPYTGQQMTGTHGDYYQLAVQTDSDNMARLLASKLPNAWVDNNSKAGTVSVYMLIPPPTFTAGQQRKGWIVSAGVVSTTKGTGNYPVSGGSSTNPGPPGASIYLPSCPTGFEGHIIFSPLEYETNDYNWGIHMVLIADNYDGGVGLTSESTSYPFLGYSSVGSGKEVRVADYPDQKTSSDTSTAIRHLVYFMTFCLPQRFSDGKIIGSEWYTSRLYSSSELEDGECSPSWVSYISGVEGNPSPDCNTSYIANVGNN